MVHSLRSLSLLDGCVDVSTADRSHGTVVAYIHHLGETYYPFDMQIRYFLQIGKKLILRLDILKTAAYTLC